MSFIFATLFYLSSLSPSQTAASPVTVYFFLGEHCIISQNFTAEMRRTYEAYGSEQVTFVGLFPNGYSTVEGIQQFQEKYQIPFPLSIDEGQKMTKKFDVKVTPEVVVYHEQKVLYQGRINDQYVRVGRRRPQPTTAELRDALQSLTANQPIAITQTTAIGCFITQISQCNTSQ
ncbi:MAG: redoxin domain-containing protein [Bacteroidota bacterium]